MNETAEEFIKRKEEQFKKDKEKRKKISFKDIGRKGKHYWLRNNWIFMKQHNNKNKVFVIEEFIRSKREGKIMQNIGNIGDIEYRFGYFIVSRKGKWTWGQYCPLIPKEDFDKLIEKTKKRGMLTD